jgi:4-aminobutyrate aminotransferase
MRLGLRPRQLGAHNNVVRMIPALVVNEAQIDDAVGLWAEAVDVATRG